MLTQTNLATAAAPAGGNPGGSQWESFLSPTEYDARETMMMEAHHQHEQLAARAREMAAAPPIRVYLGGNRAGKTKSLNDCTSFDEYARMMKVMNSDLYVQHRRRTDVNQMLHEPVRNSREGHTNLLEALRIRTLEHTVYLENHTGETPEYVRRLQAENTTLKKALVSVQRQHDNLRSEMDSLENDMAEIRSHLGL